MAGHNRSTTLHTIREEIANDTRKTATACVPTAAVCCPTFPTLVEKGDRTTEALDPPEKPTSSATQTRPTDFPRHDHNYARSYNPDSSAC